jgi:capsular exopolysaccharide synthesis family protein
MPTKTNDPTTEMPLAEALWALRKRWPVLLLFLVFCAGGALFASLRMTPIYTATATLMIQRPPEEAFGLKELYGAVAGDGQRFYRTQYDLIRSRPLVESLLHDAALGTQSWPEYREYDGEERMRRVNRNLVIEPREESFLVDVSFSARNPAKAADFVNRLSEEFARRARETNRRNQSTLATLVSDQLRETQNDLARSQDALQAFEVAQDVAAFQERQDLLVEQLKKLQEATSGLQLQLAAFEPGYRPVKALLTEGGEIAAFRHPVLDENRPIQEMKARLQEARALAVARAETHGDADPTLKGLRSQVAELTRSVELEKGAVLQGVIVKYEEKERELQRVESLRAARQAELVALDRKRREHDLLREQVQNHKEHYLGLFRKEREVGIANGEHDRARADLTAYVRVEVPAVPPSRPSRPNLKLNLSLGIGLGLLGGLFLVLFLGRVDDTVRGREELERFVDLSLLGTVPSIGARTRPAARDLVTFEEPHSPGAESYRALRTNVAFAARARRLRTLLLTSACPREGKTTSSINLAIAMAQAGQRVLLIDTDLRSPRIHHAFDLSNDEGLSLMFLPEHERSDFVRTTKVPGLSVLPAGPVPSNPAELVGSPRMQELLAGFRERFDLVLLDSPPVEAVTDPCVLAGLVDALVVVVHAGHTRRRALGRTVAALRAVGGHVLGLVLNDVRMGRGSGTYAYPYGYGSANRKDDRKVA